MGAAAKVERLGMKTLVVIDSDALSRALISQCLAGKGWRVLEADNGESGIELVTKGRPAARNENNSAIACLQTIFCPFSPFVYAPSPRLRW